MPTDIHLLSQPSDLHLYYQPSDLQTSTSTLNPHIHRHPPPFSTLISRHPSPLSTLTPTDIHLHSHTHRYQLPLSTLTPQTYTSTFTPPDTNFRSQPSHQQTPIYSHTHRYQLPLSTLTPTDIHLHTQPSHPQTSISTLTPTDIHLHSQPSHPQTSTSTLNPHTHRHPPLPSLPQTSTSTHNPHTHRHPPPLSHPQTSTSTLNPHTHRHPPPLSHPQIPTLHLQPSRSQTSPSIHTPSHLQADALTHTPTQGTHIGVALAKGSEDAGQRVPAPAAHPVGHRQLQEVHQHPRVVRRQPPCELVQTRRVVRLCICSLCHLIRQDECLCHEACGWGDLGCQSVHAGEGMLAGRWRLKGKRKQQHSSTVKVVCRQKWAHNM